MCTCTHMYIYVHVHELNSGPSHVHVHVYFSLGMLGADTSLIGSLGDVPLTSRLALIGGTSSCHMMVSHTN